MAEPHSIALPTPFLNSSGVEVTLDPEEMAWGDLRAFVAIADALGIDDGTTVRAKYTINGEIECYVVGGADK